MCLVSHRHPHLSHYHLQLPKKLHCPSNRLCKWYAKFSAARPPNPANSVRPTCTSCPGSIPSPDLVVWRPLLLIHPPRGSTKPSYISYNTGHLPSHAFYIKPHANLLPHQIQQNSHSHTYSCNVATFIPSVTVLSHNHTVMHWWFVALFLQSLYVSHDVLTKHLSSAKKDYRKIQAGTKLIRVYSGTNLSCTLEDCKLLGH